jgi:hypothetical protein
MRRNTAHPMTPILEGRIKLVDRRLASLSNLIYNSPGSAVLERTLGWRWKLPRTTTRSDPFSHFTNLPRFSRILLSLRSTGWRGKLASTSSKDLNSMTFAIEVGSDEPLPNSW